MMNNPLGNPLAFLLNAMQRGGDPRRLLQQMAAQEPMAAQVMQILSNKPERQQRDIVMNMARERGIDIESLARSMGIQIPSQR